MTELSISRGDQIKRFIGKVLWGGDSSARQDRVAARIQRTGAFGGGTRDANRQLLTGNEPPKNYTSR